MYQKIPLELVRIRTEQSCHIYTPSGNIYHLRILSLVPSFIVLHESLTLGAESPGWLDDSGFNNVNGTETVVERLEVAQPR